MPTTTNTQLEINVADIRELFAFLSDSSDTEIFAVSFLFNTSVVPGYGTYLGNLEDIISLCEKFYVSHPGFSLHVTLNQTSLTGRTRDCIIGSRVLCVDLDTKRDIKEVQGLVKGFNPGLLVESSPGKFHVYWKLSPEVSLPQWKQAQLALAHIFDGDTSLDELTHTIRVPGIPRITKEGERFLPYIVGRAIHEPLSFKDLNKVFLGWEDDYKEALKIRAAEKTKFRKNVSTWKTGGELKPATNGSKLTGRNCALYAYLNDFVIEAADEVTYEDLLIEAEKINAEVFSKISKGSLPEFEVKDITQSAFLRGSARKESIEDSIQEKTIEIRNVLLKEDADSLHGTFESYDYEADGFKAGRFTDTALVERVLQRFNQSLLRLNSVVYAFDWSTRTWRSQKLETAIIRSFVQACVTDIFLDPCFIPELCFSNGRYEPKAEVAAKNRLKSNGNISSCISALTDDHRIKTIEEGKFDSAGHLVNCANGVLDLTSLTLRPANPEDYLLFNNRVRYSAEAQCPRWLEFLQEIFAENTDPQAMIDYLQVVFGYSISGGTSIQKIFIHSGGGANGKSKVLDMLAEVSGGYCSRMVGGKVFGKNKDKEIERIAVKLEGKRIGLVDDLDSKMTWDEGLVKSLTSRSLPKRKLYEEEGDIVNRAKFHMGCNEAPKPETENHGLIRRLSIIPYERQFEACAAKENELQDMIKEEASGVLNWAIAGLHKFLESGGNLQEPEEVEFTVQEYAEDNFIITDKIESLFERAEIDNDEATWVPLNTLLEMLNADLPHSDAVTRETLGKILKKTVKAIGRRRVVKNRKVTEYLVILPNKVKQSLQGL